MKIVDKFGNLRNDPTGKEVQCKLAKFFVKNVTQKRDIMLILDEAKPYTIFNESDPMAACVKSGHYMICASLCEIV